MTIKALSIVNSTHYKWWAFIAISIGTFVSVADNGSTVVALPTIANDFDTNLPTSQWVVIGYALTISALLLPMGRLSDIIGRKQVYIVGFTVFVGGAVLASASNSITMLIFSRVIMGTGAAMTQGTGMAMVLSSFPDNERGKALGLQMSVVGVGAVAGPAFGGIIVDAFGWRGVFLVTAIVSSIAIVVSQIILDGRRPEHRGGTTRFDWGGAAISTSMLIIFLLAMSNAPTVGWGHPVIVVAFVSVVALLGSFIWWELRTPSPMFDVRLFKNRLFSLGVSASFLSFMGSQSARFLIPFYLQAVLGFGPRQVGLIIVPAAVTMIITGPIGGRLSDRYGWTKFNVGGLTLMATGLLILTTLQVDSPVWIVILALVVQSSGMGLFNAPNSSAILSTVEQSRFGVVSGFMNLIRNFANVTGIAIATAIVTAIMASGGYEPSLSGVSETADAGLLEAFTSGLRIAFRVSAGLAILGAVVSIFKGRSVDKKDSSEAGHSLGHEKTAVS